jgi:hypothetical protein
MYLKANLHFHSKEDPIDPIDYDLYEAIDHAVGLGFNVLASTCHTKNIVTEQHVHYAEKKGLLLIPGIEANIYEEGAPHRRHHVLILNCDSSANDVHTFEDLKRYREAHPEALYIAPHPYLYGNFSLGEKLEEHIELFDAIELTWFYTRWFSRNTRAAQMAKKYNKPFIATSDTHFLTFMDTNYVTVDAEERTARSFIDALKKHVYKNTTSPRSLYDIFGIFLYHAFLVEIFKVGRKTKKLQRKIFSRKKPVFAPIPVSIDEDEHAEI